MQLPNISSRMTWAALLLTVFSTLASANSTLRVGTQVLVAGDSSARVIELLGKPSSRSHARGKRSSQPRGRGVRVVNAADRGERWVYRRDDHLTTITLVDGKVYDIEDRRR